MIIPPAGSDVKIASNNLNSLIELRHNLHKHPELSNCEKQTAKTILNFLKDQHPDLVVSPIGGYGILAIYHGKEPGKTILLRCDIDALPITENTEISHHSLNLGVSHKCGHDGHMVILCGVATWLANNRPKCGTVILLFQPSEETGQGAIRIVQQLNYVPDLCYALHNLPGFPLGSIITRQGSFAGASLGLVVKLSGKTAHAAQPQEGISPTQAVVSLISFFYRISLPNQGIIATLIHATIGEVSFGTSPAEATVMVTLRAPTTKQMEQLYNQVVLEINNVSLKEKLSYKTERTEEFPATTNAQMPASIVEDVATKLGYNICKLKKPFPWSEDFGHFTAKYPGALFGLGSGENCPALHSAQYDFPDKLIPIGVLMFQGIIEKSLNI